MLSGALTVGAVDLPIDIEVIGQDTGSGEAYSANRNIELFTPDSQEISSAIIEHAVKKRETTLSGLFTANNGEDIPNVHRQIEIAAHNADIFTEPSNYTGMRMISEDSSISTWMVMIIFAASIVCGFILAGIMVQRKRGEKNVH